MAPNSVTLGRPWHPFADPHSHPSVAYVENWMDDHIGPKGWDRMSSVDSTGTRIWYEPTSARFAELRSRGPGAAISPTRPQLSEAEAASWTEANVLAGWVPDRTAAGLTADDSVASESDGEHADGRTL